MSSTASSIHVALAADDAYFKGLAATAATLVEHCGRPQNLDVHILDGGISNEHKELIRQIVATRNAHVEFLPIDQTLFDHLAPWHGTGKMCYARLLAPEILHDVQHVIYSDVDILWEADVAQLWAQRSDAYSLQYVRDKGRPQWKDSPEDKWLEEHHLSLDRDNYFCSGILLMNLAKFRADALHKKTLDLLGKAGGQATYTDQTVLNVVFSSRKDTHELPAKWQVGSMDRKGLPHNGEGAVIHFAGDCPWKPLKETNHLLTDLHLIWHRTYSDLVGISTWQSLRESNSCAMIVLGRVLYLAICHLPFFRRLLAAFLRLQGKDAGFLDAVFRYRI